MCAGGNHSDMKHKLEHLKTRLEGVYTIIYNDPNRRDFVTDVLHVYEDKGMNELLRTRTKLRIAIDNYIDKDCKTSSCSETANRVSKTPHQNSQVYSLQFYTFYHNPNPNPSHNPNPYPNPCP